MEKIIIILMIVSLIASIRKRDGILGCGLVGFAPYKKRKANLDWIKLMLVYNSSRGTDSCGIYMNETIRKGIKDEADVKNWLVNNKLEYNDECKNKAIIAHCRKSTYGASDMANAHPFTYEHDGRSIIGAHNGVIENTWQMCNAHEVNRDGLIIDSQMLFKLIAEKGYKILDEYKGYAALMWAYDNDPGAIYVFKGASRTNEYQKVLDDERPLFVIQNNDGIYISSMKEPLKAMTNGNIAVFQPGQNEVTRFFNNEISVIHTANRDDTNVIYHTKHRGKPYHNKEYEAYDNYYGHDLISANCEGDENCGRYPNDRIKVPLINEPNVIDIGTKSHKAAVIKSGEDLYKELTYGNSTSYLRDVIYYIGGRYYCFPSGNRDIYTRNMHDVDDSMHACPSMGISAYLLNGKHRMRFMGGIAWEVQKVGVPDDEFSRTDKVVEKYFYRGIMIKPERVSEFIRKKHQARFDGMKNIIEKMRELSAYSVYPITINYEESLLPIWENWEKKDPQYKYLWYEGGHKVKEAKNFCPLFTMRIYYISIVGKLMCIRSSKIVDRILNEIIQTVETVPFESVNDYVDLYNIGKYTITRYKNKNSDVEDRILQDEQYNGIGDANYFIRCDKDSNISKEIENIGNDGEEILLEAMTQFVKDVMNIPFENTEVQARKLIATAINEGVGVVEYMMREHTFSIIATITAILSEFIDDTLEEVEDKQEEEVENLVANQLLKDLGHKLLDVAPRKMKGLSFKTRKDPDLMSEEEWNELPERDRWDQWDTNKHKYGNRGD